METQVIIQVKQEHIDKAIALNSGVSYPWAATSCPVYLALVDVFGDTVKSCMQTYVNFSNKEEVVRLPVYVRERIRDYDAGLGMEPFEFEIDA